MKLTIIECAGGSTDQGFSVSFQPPGGTIGRSNGCNLQLADPEQRIAQVQALLNQRPDGWYLLNTGQATLIEIDGQRLELNQERRLLGGEQLLIGPYLLRSEASQSTPQVDMAGAGQPGTAQRPPESPTAPPEKSRAAAAPEASYIPPDPLLSHFPFVEPGADHSTQAWVSPSYFGQMPEAGFFQPASHGAARPPEEPTGQIPGSISLDPLALFAGASQPADLLDDLGPSLLNAALRAAASPVLDGHGRTVSQPPVADQVDIGRMALPLEPPPLGQPLGADAAATAQESPDLLAQIGIHDSLPLSPPAVSTLPLPELDGLAAVLEQDRPQHDAMPPSAVFAYVESTDFVPSAPWPAPAIDEFASRSEEDPQPRNNLEPPLQMSAAGTAKARATPLAQARPTAASQESSASCLAIRHFMEAAGIAQVQPAPLSLEQRMAQLGRLFRQFADGTVQLLASRTLLKHEVRAELTRVMDFDNNPFKILPSGQAVLIQMFGQPLPGFLPAEEAISDALEDLQHHQLGVLAGTRTALFRLIHELDPQHSETQTPPRGLLDRLFPSRVERRRWRHYLQRYRALLALAQSEDFYRLFGDTFRQAYEEEVGRYSTVGAERQAGGGA